VAIWGRPPTLDGRHARAFACSSFGSLLPALTSLNPGLTLLAALGCAVLRVCAIGFHVSRGEASHRPFNFLLVALSVFVLWGRRYKASIQPPV
jgi:hypothetical protein